MHMRVVFQSPGPSMQYRQDAGLAANMFRIVPDGGESFDCGLDEDVVENVLIAADNVSEFGGKSEDEMEVTGWQQLSFPSQQPPLRIIAVAFGAASVLAGMIGVLPNG